jgi:hypothetical protein
VSSSPHSLSIDVLTSPTTSIGTLFVSSSNGEFFVPSLKETNRNEYGIVDYEGLVGLEGVAMANVVTNGEEVVAGGEGKKLRTVITYDDGAFG